MAAVDATRARVMALAEALPRGGSVVLDAEALRRLAGIEPEAEAGASVVLTDLTAEAAGAELGRSASTVRAWCFQGRIPGAYRLGREWRIPRASLRRYLDAQAVLAAGPVGDGPPAAGSPVDLGRWRKHYRKGAAR